MTAHDQRNPEYDRQPEIQPEIQREIQQDVRRGRSFSLAEAIGREGSEFLKGESPVPRLIQARRAIAVCIARHLDDRAGALQVILTTWVEADDATVSRHIENPLGALLIILESIVSTPTTLYELTRQVAVKWGEMSDERPYFQKPGHPAHPDAEYSHESVHQILTNFLAFVREHDS
ncbi:MAG: hypothetical protein VKL39_03320 [Leptolyngbyaceae bacterium]|nr:hypothetical protein [Leptolyngbyaceae bacterium]